MDINIKSEVAIISIFGRGHWLAASLARHQVPVTLLDVSAQMGDWTPQDIEGPFGYFESGLADSEKERLEVESQSIPVPHGMTLWLSDGPLELMGPTTDHRLQHYQIPPVSLGYIRGEKKIEELKELSFQQSWLVNLAHAFSSSIATHSLDATRESLKRNILSSFFIRQVKAQDHQKSLQWCEDQGVKVLRNVEIKDISFEERRLANLEIRIDKPGIFKAEQFVLCLTSEEASMLSPKIQKALFPQGVVEPEWAWLRYQIRMQGQGPLSHLTRAQIPLHCIVIEDLMLPWSHENMLVLQKTSQQDEFDAWVKLPNNQRFQSQYLIEQGQKIKALLEKKISENEIFIEQLPAESKGPFQKIGPTRHPVFSRSLRAARKSHHIGNIFLDSPEFWSALSWEGQFHHQNRIDQVLKTAWSRKEELRLKREAKEAAKRKKQNKDSGADL